MNTPTDLDIQCRALCLDDEWCDEDKSCSSCRGLRIYLRSLVDRSDEENQLLSAIERIPVRGEPL